MTQDEETSQETKPGEQEIARNADGTFKPGVSGNPSGRPQNVSIVKLIRQKFADNPEGLEDYVDEILKDPKMKKDVMEQLDGKPKQYTDITSDDKPIAIPIYGGESLQGHDSDKEDIQPNPED